MCVRYWDDNATHAKTDQYCRAEDCLVVINVNNLPQEFTDKAIQSFRNNFDIVLLQAL